MHQDNLLYISEYKYPSCYKNLVNLFDRYESMEKKKWKGNLCIFEVYSEPLKKGEQNCALLVAICSCNIIV